MGASMLVFKLCEMNTSFDVVYQLNDDVRQQ